MCAKSPWTKLVIDQNFDVRSCSEMARSGLLVRGFGLPWRERETERKKEKLRV